MIDLAEAITTDPDTAYLVRVDKQGNHTTYSRCCQCRKPISSSEAGRWAHVVSTALCRYPHPQLIDPRPHTH